MSARISVVDAGGRNMLAFLDLIAFSEIGVDLLAASDDGYNVIVGGSLFHDYSTHPRLEQEIKRPNGDVIRSDAAGRYQLMGRYFLPYQKQLGLPDFGPVSQDRIAIQLIHECHAVNLIQDGQVQAAVIACKSRWASFPGANYPGQHMNPMAPLVTAYTQAGGTLNEPLAQT